MGKWLNCELIFFKLGNTIFGALQLLFSFPQDTLQYNAFQSDLPTASLPGRRVAVFRLRTSNVLLLSPLMLLLHSAPLSAHRACCIYSRKAVEFTWFPPPSTRPTLKPQGIFEVQIVPRDPSTSLKPYGFRVECRESRRMRWLVIACPYYSRIRLLKTSHQHQRTYRLDDMVGPWSPHLYLHHRLRLASGQPAVKPAQPQVRLRVRRQPVKFGGSLIAACHDLTTRSCHAAGHHP